VKSSEQAARRIYEGLSAADQQLVLAWRQLGNDWCTSVLNSGVMTRGRRHTPHEAAVKQFSDDYTRVILEWQRYLMGSDPRREQAEHEAAHAVVAQALGLKVRAIAIDLGGQVAGECYHARGTPFQTATIALAGEMWIGLFRSYEFPRGPRGCESDRRCYLTLLPSHLDLDRARRECFEILRANRALVLSRADQLDADGGYLPDS
jgi:hypothetical protein